MARAMSSRAYPHAAIPFLPSFPSGKLRYECSQEMRHKHGSQMLYSALFLWIIGVNLNKGVRSAIMCILGESSQPSFKMIVCSLIEGVKECFAIGECPVLGCIGKESLEDTREFVGSTSRLILHKHCMQLLNSDFPFC